MESKREFFNETRFVWITALFELGNIFFAHHLFQPGYLWVSSIIHFVAAILLLYHILAIVRKSYDNFSNINSKMSLFENRLQKNNDNVDFLIGTINQYEFSKAHGIIKKISDPTIWELTGEIVGWNPNWAIEMSSTQLSHQLNVIHNERITSNFVESIEYFFLEDYKIDEFNNAKFGSECFIEFLNKLLSSISGKQEQNYFIQQAIKKYHLWKIERSHWDSDNELAKFIGSYKDSILIGGKKHSHFNFVMFQNMRPFLTGGSHEYYFEIFGFDPRGIDTRIVTQITSFFRDLKTINKTKNVNRAILAFDENNRTFIIS